MGISQGNPWLEYANSLPGFRTTDISVLWKSEELSDLWNNLDSNMWHFTLSASACEYLQLSTSMFSICMITVTLTWAESWGSTVKKWGQLSFFPLILCREATARSLCWQNDLWRALNVWKSQTKWHIIMIIKAVWWTLKFSCRLHIFHAQSGSLNTPTSLRYHLASVSHSQNKIL